MATCLLLHDPIEWLVSVLVRTTAVEFARNIVQSHVSYHPDASPFPLGKRVKAGQKIKTGKTKGKL
jgi:hypothetical protein